MTHAIADLDVRTVGRHVSEVVQPTDFDTVLRRTGRTNHPKVHLTHPNKHTDDDPTPHCELPTHNRDRSWRIYSPVPSAFDEHYTVCRKCAYRWWDDADARRRRGLPAGVLERDICRVADLREETPSTYVYARDGLFTVGAVYNRFESWGDALAASRELARNGDGGEAS